MYKKEEEQLQLGRSEQRVVYINVALTFLAPPPSFPFSFGGFHSLSFLLFSCFWNLVLFIYHSIIALIIINNREKFCTYN